MAYSVFRRERRHRLLAIRFVILLAVVGLLITGRFYVAQVTAKPVPLNNGQVFTSKSPEPIAPRVTTKELPAELIVTGLDVSSPIQTIVDEFISQFPDATFGISIKALDGSFEASKFPQQTFIAASLYKTLAAYKVLQRVDQGSLSLDKFVDDEHTLNDCLGLAITISDNSCGMILQALAHGNETDKQSLAWGYAQTTLSGVLPTTSAVDQTSLFSDIYNGKRLSKNSQKLLLNLLKGQRINNRTPSYENANIYHKTGDIFGIVNSSAIIESPQTVYAISILSDNWNQHLLDKYAAITKFHNDINDQIERTLAN